MVFIAVCLSPGRPPGACRKVSPSRVNSLLMILAKSQPVETNGQPSGSPMKTIPPRIYRSLETRTGRGGLDISSRPRRELPSLRAPTDAAASNSAISAAWDGISHDTRRTIAAELGRARRCRGASSTASSTRRWTSSSRSCAPAPASPRAIWPSSPRAARSGSTVSSPPGAQPSPVARAGRRLTVEAGGSRARRARTPPWRMPQPAARADVPAGRGCAPSAGAPPPGGSRRTGHPRSPASSRRLAPDRRASMPALRMLALDGRDARDRRRRQRRRSGLR